MLKKRLCLLLCSALIMGTFSKPVFANDMQSDSGKLDTTITTTDNNKVNEDNVRNENTSVNTTNNKDSDNTVSEKEQFPKADLHLLFPQEIVANNMYMIYFNSSIEKRCLAQEEKINEYLTKALPITSTNKNFDKYLKDAQKYRTDMLKNKYTRQYTAGHLLDAQWYKENNKNLSPDALNFLNQYIKTNKAKLHALDSELDDIIKNYVSSVNSARSSEPKDDIKDYENVLNASMMQAYCSQEIKDAKTKQIDYFKTTAKNTIAKLLKENLNGKPITVSVKKAAPAKQNTVISKQVTGQTINTSIKVKQLSAKKTLPKTGGSCAAPLASLSLILSGSLLMAVNKMKKH